MGGLMNLGYCLQCGMPMPRELRSDATTCSAACLSEKRCAEHKVYREANLDRIRDRERAYNAANKDKTRAYYEANKGKLRTIAKTYREANKDRINAYREANKDKDKPRAKAYREANKDKAKAYREANKDRINALRLKRYVHDPCYKLRNSLRSRSGQAIRSNQKGGSAVRDLGCTIAELRAYIEALFLPGMTWESWAPDGWHLDHIRPLASFDLTDREQFLQACHYTNLQPLWAKDNLAKGAKYDKVTV